MVDVRHRLIPATDARDSIGDICNRVAYGHESIVLTRYGRPLLAMIPVHRLELLEQYSSHFGLTVRTKSVSIVETKERFSSLCKQVADDKEVVLVTKSGKPQLAFVPLDNSEFALEELERYSAIDDTLRNTADQGEGIQGKTLQELKDKYRID